MKNLLLAGLLLIMCSCGTTKTFQKAKLLNEHTFLLSEVSTDEAYGYNQKKPIKVGGVDKSEGPLNERRFLNALAGPNGEFVSYTRVGSCCAFKSKKGFMGKALLDRYEVSWDGLDEPLIIYINMYDYGELKAPVGFTIKK